MNHVLLVYDIPQRLKMGNPSVILRRFGVRVNLSCWVFPADRVPHDIIKLLNDNGATTHLVEFAEQAQEKILALARDELRKHSIKLCEFMNDKVLHLKQELANLECKGLLDQDKKESIYKKWRSVISRSKRELISAEQCALGFGINRDVERAMDGVKSILYVQTNACMVLRDELKQAKQVQAA